MILTFKSRARLTHTVNIHHSNRTNNRSTISFWPTCSLSMSPISSWSYAEYRDKAHQYTDNRLYGCCYRTHYVLDRHTHLLVCESDFLHCRAWFSIFNQSCSLWTLTQFKKKSFVLNCTNREYNRRFRF